MQPHIHFSMETVE